MYRNVYSRDLCSNVDYFSFEDAKFFAYFRRWKVLQVAVDERYKLLSGFGKDGSTPGSQAFLASSVEPPWERALTPAKVPYYIK